MGAAVALDTEAFAQHNRPSRAGLGMGRGAQRSLPLPPRAQKLPEGCVLPPRALPQGLPPSAGDRVGTPAPDPAVSSPEWVRLTPLFTMPWDRLGPPGDPGFPHPAPRLP